VIAPLREPRLHITIAVEDQEPRSQLELKRFPKLLNNPEARRMLCDVEVQSTPPVMPNDEEAIAVSYTHLTLPTICSV